MPSVFAETVLRSIDDWKNENIELKEKLAKVEHQRDVAMEKLSQVEHQRDVLLTTLTNRPELIDQSNATPERGRRAFAK